MEMIRDYGPSKARGSSIDKNPAESLKKLVTICIVFENFLTLDAPGNDVMQCAWRIDSRFAWHVDKLSGAKTDRK
jgi:hypothetical protein